MELGIGAAGGGGGPRPASPELHQDWKTSRRLRAGGAVGRVRCCSVGARCVAVVEVEQQHAAAGDPRCRRRRRRGDPPMRPLRGVAGALRDHVGCNWRPTRGRASRARCAAAEITRAGPDEEGTVEDLVALQERARRDGRRRLSRLHGDTTKLQRSAGTSCGGGRSRRGSGA